MATIPSIAMIPSGYKANKVYSVLPTDGSGDLDSARTSTATRINSGGLIEEVLTGVPRLDYTNGTCPSLLLEPASTNLVINSAEGFYGIAPASSTNIISPDGTNNAYIPVPDSVADRYEQSIPLGTYATGQKLTYSWYRKRISTPTGTAVVGDLNIKSLVNLTELEASNARQVQSDINGFDRFEAVVEVIDGSLSSTFRAYFGDVVGIGNSSIAYWGHQFEALEYSTSIIITTGTAQTRTADTASKSGISSLINSIEGVFYFEGSALANDGSDRYITLNDGSSDNEIRLYYFSTSNGIALVIRKGGSSVVSESYVTTNVLVFNKFAVKWKENDVALWVNGIEVDTELSFSSFNSNALNKLSFSRGDGSGNFEGNVKDIRVYKTALSDSELTTLTTI